MFDVFSSDRVRGSGGEVLGARAMVDVLEERRLLSASVEAGFSLFAEPTVPAVEAGLDLDTTGLDVGKVTPIDLSGANGSRTFSAARIDDGAGREDLHGTGAAVEWLEKVHVRTEGPPLTLVDNKASGAFSTGRILKGNMRPVTTTGPGNAANYAHVFAV
jgi:hypothetical protein